MSAKLYVGNLPYSTDDDALGKLFADHGTVDSAVVIMDKYSGRSKGFGFVEMSSAEEAEAATKALDGSEVEGRNIKVSPARPREERPSQEG